MILLIASPFAVLGFSLPLMQFLLIPVDISVAITAIFCVLIIFLFVKVSFFMQAILIDNEEIVGSLAISWQVTKRNWWRMLILSLIFLVPQAVINPILSRNISFVMIKILASIFFTAYMATSWTVAYLRLRSTLDSEEGRISVGKYKKYLNIILAILVITFVCCVMIYKFVRIPLRTYYKNGQLKDECHYKNGKREGVWRMYSEDGKLISESNYRNDKEVGITRYYYEDGTKAEIPYKDGKWHGVVKWYYKNGKLKFEKPMKNGETEGVYREYDESGNLIKEEIYKNGELISSKEITQAK